MSDLSIGIVAEGVTDFVVFVGALKAILGPVTFVPQMLQPEDTQPRLGGGWGGIVRWGQQMRKLTAGCLDDCPTLSRFDLIIVHLDADVAEYRYADLGADMDQTASDQGWPCLPCSMPCPPPSDAIEQLQTRLLSWMPAPGPKVVICIPSKRTEAWLAAAVFSENESIQNGLECNLELNLEILPKSQRIRKNRREYQSFQSQITSNWNRVKNRCTQALLFDQNVHTALAVSST